MRQPGTATSLTPTGAPQSPVPSYQVLSPSRPLLIKPAYHHSSCPVSGIEANVALLTLQTALPTDPAATLVDSWVDTALFQLAEGSTKGEPPSSRASTPPWAQSWLAGGVRWLACACTTRAPGGSASSAPAGVQRWLKSSRGTWATLPIQATSAVTGLSQDQTQRVSLPRNKVRGRRH
ncbi:aminoacyl tRNA synthase complex-interacting multifunctional protein 2 isoform X1 [Lates japonicus]|uniref:Aminoacyl tRNA synthase complex-interacting multifunctional protein 2 isoform X1 n=1 Tax=Lates japonicus TaxID=270547 RepID=A0AAD3N774_LATJO|nr:aminoacyl tRNA synthase complex-interacting multifunctional protein 2 isoform X1 [Lates japonicus]